MDSKSESASVFGGGSVATVKAPRLSPQERLSFDRLSAHHAALRRVGASVDTRANATHASAKKVHAAAASRALVARQRAIEQANATLVAKLTDAAVKTRSPYAAPAAVGDATAAAASVTGSAGHSQAQPRSLNLPRRKAEAARIASANLALARRIVNQRPTIGARDEWGRHALRHEQRLQTLSRYGDVPAAAHALLAQPPPHQALYSHPQLPLTAQPTPFYPGGGGPFSPMSMSLPLGALPPGVTPEMYVEAMRQMALQPFPQPFPPPFAPSPPSHARGTTPGSRGGASGAGSTSLHPLPDEARRTARLTRQMLAVERDKFGPSPQTERLLRPLRRRTSEDPAGASSSQFDAPRAASAASSTAGLVGGVAPVALAAEQPDTQQIEPAAASSSATHSPPRPAGTVASSHSSPLPPPPPNESDVRWLRTTPVPPAHAPSSSSGRTSHTTQPPAPPLATLVLAPRAEPILVLRKAHPPTSATSATTPESNNNLPTSAAPGAAADATDSGEAESDIEA